MSSMHRRRFSTSSISIPRSSLESVPFSYATVSVKSPEGSLEQKLKAISSAGFTGIELGFPDLLAFACKYLKNYVKEDDYRSLCKAGEEVKKLAAKYKLRIVMLQPFANFEGWPKSSKGRQDAFNRARGWIKIMQAVGTDMLQVGSTDAEKIVTTEEDLASDLAELADMLAEHNFRLAYENWCWATVAPTWEKCWSIVQKADRPNIGMCLDTFQTVCGIYGDPTTNSSLNEGAGLQQKLEMNLAASLKNLKDSVPSEKIYILQLSDAYRPPAPFKADGENGEANEVGPDGEKVRARAKWSHDYRPYLFNGGYFTDKCVSMCRAVLGTGFRGWFSVEVFDAKASIGDLVDMKKYCKGAMDSCSKLMAECADSN